MVSLIACVLMFIDFRYEQFRNLRNSISLFAFSRTKNRRCSDLAGAKL